MNSLSMVTLKNNQSMVCVNGLWFFFSYDTPIVSYSSEDKTIKLYRGFNYSTTTNRYTNEFFNRLGVNISVSEIRKEKYNGYTVVEED